LHFVCEFVGYITSVLTFSQQKCFLCTDFEKAYDWRQIYSVLIGFGTPVKTH